MASDQKNLSEVGVLQDSVLSPHFFEVVMDEVAKDMRDSS